MRCKICHRPLTDPKSIEKGIGPVCASKGEYQNNSLFNEEKKHHIVTCGFNGDIILARNKEGRPLVNIPQEIEYHSPTGFEWGYGGSGPADLALNILLKFTNKDIAFALHQSFKWRIIATLPEEGGIIKGEEIKNWIQDKINIIKNF